MRSTRRSASRPRSDGRCRQRTGVALTSSAQSTALNQSRLEVLRKRDEQLNELFEDANKQVKELSDGENYAKAMDLLITEVGKDSS